MTVERLAICTKSINNVLEKEIVKIKIDETKQLPCFICKSNGVESTIRPNEIDNYFDTYLLEDEIKSTITGLLVIKNKHEDTIENNLNTSGLPQFYIKYNQTLVYIVFNTYGIKFINSLNVTITNPHITDRLAFKPTMKNIKDLCNFIKFIDATSK